MPFQLVRNDITCMNVDAIVNAANMELQEGGGVCGAIFKRAGASRLRAACDAIRRCDVGHAVITPGFDLPARYVIHAVGPVWHGGSRGEAALLRSAYLSALEIARDHHVESIAFPLISAGIYGYPKREAMSIAVGAISDFLLENDMMVYLVIYDRSAFELGEKLQGSIQAYIDDRYVDAHAMARGRQAQYLREIELEERMAAKTCDAPAAAPSMPRRDVPAGEMFDDCAPVYGESALGGYGSLESIVSTVGDTFAQRLFRLIDDRGLTDPQVYKRANLDRKLFSKIRTKPDYRPARSTALALCVALELDMPQTEDLLRCAGLALSPGNKGDLIVEYFIQHKSYDIITINEALFAFDQELLGAKA